MNSLFPYHLTGSAGVFNPKGWFYLVVTTLLNCVPLAMFTATIVLTVKALW